MTKINLLLQMLMNLFQNIIIPVTDNSIDIEKAMVHNIV